MSFKLPEQELLWRGELMNNLPTGRTPLFILLHTLSTGKVLPMYIAALQRTIASRSDCLLPFGRGNFQEVSLSAYLHGVFILYVHLGPTPS